MGLLPVSHGVGVVERALELGVNYFDTAPLYGKGRSEEVLGHALKEVTEDYYLATKVGYYPEPFDYTRDTIRVNLLQLHEAEQAGWDGIMDAGRAIETMIDIREQGITDHIGLTGSDLGLMSKVLRETDEFVSVITFLKYDLLTREAKEELIPAAVDGEVAVICASPLHGGLLGSKRDHWVEQGRFSDLYDRLEKVEELVQSTGEPIERVGLRYILSDPEVSMILSGVASIEELETSVSVSDGQVLDEGLIKEIEAIT
jgi:aryl-alcohol dehydrogenase-like predicted oxidoreductase